MQRLSRILEEENKASKLVVSTPADAVNEGEVVEEEGVEEVGVLVGGMDEVEEEEPPAKFTTHSPL